MNARFSIDLAHKLRTRPLTASEPGETALQAIGR
jgi:hypothetical protein